MPGNTRWSDGEDQIIINNYGVVKYADMVKLLPRRTEKAITHRAKYLGLSGLEQRASFLSKLYRTFVDDHFFSEFTTLSCYYAGLLAADGYIHKCGKRVSINLCEKDKEYLEIFKTSAAYDGSIYGPMNYKKRSLKAFENSTDTYRLDVCSPQWVVDLKEKFNIENKKSLKANPPNIYDIDLMLCFVCGLIDGDGCIGSYPSKNKYYPRIIIAGTEDILLWVKKLVDLLFPSSNSSIACVAKPKDKNIYYYTFSGQRCIKFYEAVSSFELPLFIRKWVILANAAQSAKISAV